MVGSLVAVEQATCLGVQRLEGEVVAHPIPAVGEAGGQTWCTTNVCIPDIEGACCIFKGVLYLLDQ